MSYTPPTAGTENWDVPLNAALADIDDTATTAQTTADSKANEDHTHPVTDIDSGAFSVGRGGTGLTSITNGNFLTGSSTANLMQQRTPAQVRSDVGADNATNLTSGTVAIARLPATVTDYVTDTGALTNLGVTAATGWTKNVVDHQVIGKVMYIHFNFNRSGADIVDTGSNANIADVPICTITSSAMRPQWTITGWGRGSETGGGVELTTAGVLSLLDLYPGTTLASATNLQTNMTYTIA